jgi:hypothetical protein
MAVPKYEKQYQEMIKNNQRLFDSLKTTKRGTEAFKDIQKKVLRIISINENALCSRTERTHFSNFSMGLAEKFWEKIRVDYPEVDFS